MIPRFIALLISLCAVLSLIRASPLTGQAVFNPVPDVETTALAEFLEACKDRNLVSSTLCAAYNDITEFYSKLFPNTTSVLLNLAFEEYHAHSVADLCSVLKDRVERVPLVFNQTNGTVPIYKKTLTTADICRRRCGELDENDQEVVIPVCKVIAYELGKIVQQVNASKPAPGPVAVKDTALPVQNASNAAPVPDAKPLPPLKLDAPPVLLRKVNNVTTVQVPAASPVVNNTQTQQVLTKSRVTPSGVVSVQSAEDVKPPEPVSGHPRPLTVTTTSTEDPSSSLMVNNGAGFMDEGAIQKIEDNSPPASAVVPAKPEVVGGSLDNETGGDLPNVAEPDYEDDDDAASPADEEHNISSKTEQEVEKVEPVKQSSKLKPTFNEDEGSLEVHSSHAESRPNSAANVVIDDPFYEESDSNFFAYFMFFMVACVALYVAYHNKSKLVALLLEGRRSGTSSSRAGGGRKKHTAAYSKLDSNLEEAITSSAQSRTAQIIY